MSATLDDKRLKDAPLLEHMLVLTQPTLSIDKDDVAFLQRCMRATQSWQHRQLEQMLRRCNGATALLWYSSDTSPLSTRVVMRNKVGGLLFLQKTKQTSEFVLQSLFLSSSSEVFGCTFEPVSVGDKSAASHFRVWQEHALPDARDLMSEGILVECYCFDGGLQSGMNRLHRQWHAAYYHVLQQGDDEAGVHLRELTHWILNVRCTMHIAHGALKKALQGFAEDKVCMKSAWVVLASLRQSIGQLGKVGPSWINQRIGFAEWSMSVRDQEHLWRLLGLPTEVIDDLLRLGLRWDAARQQLLVSPAHVSCKTLTQDVLAVLQACWRFKEFSDSRFIGMGSCSRTVVAAVLLGLENLVQFVKDQKAESNYFVNGFSRFTPEVKALMSLACLTSYLPETVLGLLHHDDRLAVIYPEVLNEIKDELAFAHAIPSAVLDFISTGMSFVGCYVDAVHTGMAIAAAAIHNGIAYMTEPPFSLCIGDVESNLSLFKTATEPTEETARKIWLLLAMDFNPSMLVAGIGRLRDMKHSSMTCEQAHAAGTVFMKLHRTYTSATMRCRSFAYQLKPQLTEAPESVSLQRLKLQMQKVQKSNPNKIGAYQAFVSEMETLAHKKRQKNPAGFSKHICRQVLENAGRVYCQFGDAKKRGFKDVAHDMRDDKLAAKNEKIALLAHQIVQLKQQLLQEDDADKPMLLSRCRFNDNDVYDLEQTILKWPETAAETHSRCVENGAKVYALPDHIASTLGMFEVQEVSQLSLKFPWLSHVCQNREFFLNTVFRFTMGDSTNHYKFLYAMQNPLFISFVRVIPFEKVIPFADPMAQMHQPELYCWDHYFSCSWDTFVFTTAAFEPLAATVHVLTDVFSEHGGELLKADGHFEALDDIARKFRVGRAPRQAPAAGSDDPTPMVGDAEPPLWVQFPWLLQEDNWGLIVDADNPNSRQVAPPRPAETRYKEDLDLHEMDADEVWEELRAQRESWRERAAHGAPDFPVNIRGGVWTAENTGEASDSVRAQASGETAVHFCELYGLTKSATFAYSFYTQELAYKLAEVWADHMQFWFDLWFQKGMFHDTRFLHSDRTLYATPLIAQALREEGSERVLKRLDLVLSIAPPLHAD